MWQRRPENASLCRQIVFGEHVIAHEPAAFSFSGKCANPIEHIIFGIVAGNVFNMIPNAEQHFHKFFSDFVAVRDNILSAYLYPPISRGDFGVIPVCQILFGICIRPNRLFEGNGYTHIFGCEHQGISHHLIVAHVGRVRLAEILLALSAVHKLRARAETEKPVARSVCKIARRKAKLLFCRRLHRRDRTNAVFFH